MLPGSDLSPIRSFPTQLRKGSTEIRHAVFSIVHQKNKAGGGTAGNKKSDRQPF